MTLKMRHLEVFNALLDAGSVSRAAERLNLTQPAVSIALSNFEAELGFRLFHRERGFFAPTKEAMLLHDKVAQGLRAISQIEKLAQDIHSGQTGAVSIATNGVLAVNFLPKLLAPFQRDHPNIRVEIKVHSSRQIASWVASHHIDIGLIDPPVPVAGLDAEIFDFECVCTMHKDDPLAALDTIHPQSLVGRSVISIITGDHMIDRQLDALLAETDTVVARNTSAYYFAIARNLVAEGNGVAILDPINGKIDLHDGVVWRPFTPRIDNSLAVITAKGQPLGQAADEILSRIRAGLRKFIN
ncbi:LysR family transcriptional regulator [uncultured Roseovarius sp.]|uniref:LysR family transcriptional regulator n=1 Tax=Roseovarius sp. TaxID=1486281 RepID=UPI0025D89C65|nr:LysR substrate-binding domain-containing protein [uncultured Roseovarius sp.]